MPEMPAAGEHHGDAGLIAGFDGILVPEGAAGLDDGGDARPGGGFDGVAEGEEGVGGHNGAPGFFTGGTHGEVNGAHPVGLTAADAGDGPAGGEDDAVGFNVLHHPPGELQVPLLLFGGPDSGGNPPLGGRQEAPVRGLEADAPVHREGFPLIGGGTLEGEHPEVLLPAEAVQGAGGVGRGGDNFEEDIHEQIGGLLIHFPVEGRHAAENRDGIGLAGSRPGLGGG